MIVAECEAYIHELARHTTSIFNTKYERICYFVRGLRHLIRMATQCLVATGRTFVEVLDHAKVIEEMHCKSHEAVIRGLGSRVDSMRAIVGPNSWEVFFMMGILCIHIFNLRVILVD